MDYRYLEAFLVTARHLNFTKAANDLGVTQAAVSRQIRLLEESLDRQLLIRSPQRVLLTRDGERLFRHARELDHWIDEDLIAGTPTVKIAILQGVLENWAIDLIDRCFKEDSINFMIETGTQTQINQAIETGRVDVGINSHQVHNDVLTSFKVMKEEIVVVSCEPVDLKKLQSYPWVTFDPATFLIPYCKKRSSRIIQVESNTAVLQLVKKRAGITMVPLHTIPNPEDFLITPTTKFKNEIIWATTLAYSKMPPFLQGFLKRLRSYGSQSITD